MNVSVSLANVLASLTTMASAFPKHGAIQTKMSGWRVVKARNEITLVISNEDKICIYIISIVKPGVLIDGVSETLKHKIEKYEVGFLEVCY